VYVKFWKRIIDVFLTIIAIMILMPIVIPVMVILLFTGEHEVFYKQTRLGYKNGQFKILKFASMLKNSPNLGAGSLTVRNDPRVLPFGRFLRITKINELPQLINVLKGDMSLVGARPQMIVDFEKFPTHVQEHIYDTLPGITGIGSIIFRDEEKRITNAKGDIHKFDCNYIAPYKGEVELWYQQHISFRTDFLLLFITIWVVLFPSSEIIYKIFPSLPEKPEELRG
jgi:lipopolysaccharide/colanic/teichoic acid biosynthesis glycosyltransferase